jgi:hypothetical protein
MESRCSQRSDIRCSKAYSYFAPRVRYVRECSAAIEKSSIQEVSDKARIPGISTPMGHSKYGELWCAAAAKASRVACEQGDSPGVCAERSKPKNGSAIHRKALSAVAQSRHSSQLQGRAKQEGPENHSPNSAKWRESKRTRVEEST